MGVVEVLLAANCDNNNEFNSHYSQMSKSLLLRLAKVEDMSLFGAKTNKQTQNAKNESSSSSRLGRRTK